MLVNSRKAAEELGVSVLTLYGWLAESDRGEFSLNGQSITIDYFQSGAKGQGRIWIDTSEVKRLQDAMRMQPRRFVRRRSPVQQFPGITVKLGRPTD